MAEIFRTGFESGTPASEFTAVSNTPTYVSDFAYSGTQSMRCDTSDDYVRKEFTASNICVAHFRIRVSATHATDPRDVFRFQDNAGSHSFSVGVLPDGDQRLAIYYDFGNVIAARSGAITLDQWYRIEMWVNSTANPWTVDWRVDGADQSGGTPAVAAVAFDRAFVGPIGGGTFDVRFDDLVIYTGSDGDYPPGDIRIGEEDSATLMTLLGIG